MFLLGLSNHYPPGRFSALAGFVEPGETIEAAVARELKEEAGIEVVDIRYLASPGRSRHR
jgi:NAD+ diphosphatase